MKLYPKLAVSGMAKNARLYLPYLITGSMMAAMFYILGFLNFSTAFVSMGGGSMGVLISLGWAVIGIFSAIIMFYTHTFLIRRRMKEFGMYNILGMGKLSVCAVLLWENAITAAVVSVSGVLIGAALSKLAELLLGNIVHLDVGYDFSLSPISAAITVIYCFVIFTLIFIISAVRLRLSDPVGMMRAEAGGEKPPKVNWLLGIGGFILLGAAYWMAVTIEDPIDALNMFFFCVLMVIAATFILFIAGSVMICRLMKSSKRYYYKPNHFVSVSQMSWRMKRSGAGLAAICILCTMVLVTIVTTTCLYSGMEERLRDRYNNDMASYIVFRNFDDASDENYAFLRQAYTDSWNECGLTPKKTSEFTFTVMNVPVEENQFILDGNIISDDLDEAADWIPKMEQAYLISADDYMKETGIDLSLSDGEAALYVRGAGYNRDTLRIGEREYAVKTILSEPGITIWTGDAVDAGYVLYIIVPDFRELVETTCLIPNTLTFSHTAVYRYIGIDTDAPDEAQADALWLSKNKTDELWAKYNNISVTKEDDRVSEHPFVYTNERSLAVDRNDFYSAYGTLFFLGIFFSAIFLMAAVLIMYYKQISEGYEDQTRFGIMRKVGMTDRDIRRSVNSQVLTVFFAPLAAAVLHLCFAYPMLSRMIYLFGVNSRGQLLAVAAISVGVFALGYLIMYKVTSRSYYAIVSGDGD